MTSIVAADIASPLALVERSVQDHAKAIALDTASPAGEAKLRSLIDEAVEAWQDDHGRPVAALRGHFLLRGDS